MSTADVITLLPLIIIAVAAVAIMMAIAVSRRYRLSAVLALGGLALALASLPFIWPYLPREVTPLLVLDSYATFYMGLVIAASLVVGVLSYGYLRSYGGNREEYYLLLLLAAVGAVVLVASNHFASFFLGLEILSIALYVLIAYSYAEEHRLEAGIKYLILAAASAAFLLFGMALIYMSTGTLEFSQMSGPVAEEGFSVIWLLGLAMILVGIGFKLALVPFHLWTPDVYQGAPAPVTAFVATVSKGAVLALMLRFFNGVNLPDYAEVMAAFAAISVLSMLAGNLLALLQNNVKRLLAYSSIAHLGYLMIPFIAGGSLAQPAIGFYLLAYFPATLAGFGVITMLSTVDGELEDLEAYRGLFWRRPGLAIILAASLFSLASIPPTGGLVAKFFVFAAGVQSTLWLLLIVLVVASVVGVFYYARVAITLFMRPEEEAEAVEGLSLRRGSAALLSLLTLLLLWLGIYPGPTMDLITELVNGALFVSR